MPETKVELFKIVELCFTRHDWINIFVSGGWDESANVVRWCRRCGSVKVDLDFDNRTRNGQMRVSQLCQAFVPPKLVANQSS
jgi:hypothetical protein